MSSQQHANATHSITESEVLEMKTPKRVEGNEMPSRPMNAEPPQPAGGGKAPSLQKGEMPTRAMDEPEPNIPPRALSPREQDKLAAHRRDQTARAAAEKNK
jgi:hypothetical protein